jgi:hypothetical protein
MEQYAAKTGSGIDTAWESTIAMKVLVLRSKFSGEKEDSST